MGGLYVIRIPNGPCKIGKARDVYRRMAELQTSHPYTLELVAWLPDRGHEEPVWHHCFDDYRLRGEWFEWCEAIERAIDLVARDLDWTQVAAPPPELIAELESYGSPADAAALYRTCLRDWIAKRSRGECRLTALPPRTNTPRTPKSPGPLGYRKPITC